MPHSTNSAFEIEDGSELKLMSKKRLTLCQRVRILLDSQPI